MSRSAISVCIFGIYLILSGVTFLLFPNLIQGAFGFPPAQQSFVRIMGMWQLFLGMYYFQASRHAWVDFFRLSVYLRASVTLFFGAFVLLGFAGPPIMLFAVVDVLCAIWTAWALQSEHEPVLARNPFS